MVLLGELVLPSSMVDALRRAVAASIWTLTNILLQAEHDGAAFGQRLARRGVTVVDSPIVANGSTQSSPTAKKEKP